MDDRDGSRSWCEAIWITGHSSTEVGRGTVTANVGEGHHDRPITVTKRSFPYAKRSVDGLEPGTDVYARGGIHLLRR